MEVNTMSEQELNLIFANNLTKLLDRRGLSQVDVANALNVSESAVSLWCSGKTTPRMSKVDKLCELLKCSRSALIAEDGAALIEKDDVARMLQDLYDKDHVLLKSMADTTPEELAQLRTYLKFLKSQR